MRERTVRTGLPLLLLALVAAPALAEDGDGGFEGSVEVVHRNVSVDGSQNKYYEDFDGLDSGARLSSLSLQWTDIDASGIDYAWIDASGLGGDPYERTHIRLGQTDTWEVRLTNRKQSYLYDLFGLVPDEDGHQWNTDRRQTQIHASFTPTENFTFFVEYDEGRRSGDSVFMKDIERDLFLLDTPVDSTAKRYTVGADFRFGVVDLLVRQSLRRYDNQFDNETEGNLGLNTGDNATLDSYAWLQNDSSSADLTQVQVHAPIGDRVDVTLGVYGTFLGEEELESRVNVNASGTDFTRSCSVSGGACTTDADCDPIGFPGDSCDPNPYSIVDGFSAVDVESDTAMYDLDIGIRIVDPVSLHLEYRSLDRDVTGTGTQDLDGNGTIDPVSTMVDYQIDTITGRVVVQAHRTVTFNVGFRTIDRELVRDGFGTGRDVDYESNGDETLVAGVTWRPNRTFRLSADYEDGDVDQPLTAPSPYERERTRVRATWRPQDDMQVNVSWLDSSNSNTATDFRPGALTWDRDYESQVWSVAFSHRANETFDYAFEYADGEIDGTTAVIFDTAAFGGTESGSSAYMNDYTRWSARLNARIDEHWSAWIRFATNESDGNDLLLGNVSGVVSNAVLDQDFTDGELGVRHTFDSGMWLGASFRSFDYDEFNDLLDYDGEIFSILAGINF